MAELLTQRRVLLAKPRGYCAGVDRAVQAVERHWKIRAPRLRAPADRAQHPRRPTLEKRGAIFVDRGRRGAAGRGRGVLRARHRARGPPGRRPPRPARDRRHLPAGHQGAQRGAPVRRARTTTSCWSATPGTRRSWAPRARRPTGSAWSTAPTARRTSRSGIHPGWSGCRRRRCRWTRPRRRSTRCASAFPALLDPPSDDICYATQNRQAAVKVIAAQADLVIVVGSPNSSNSVRLVEVAARPRRAPPTWSMTPARSTSAGWTGSRRSA